MRSAEFGLFKLESAVRSAAVCHSVAHAPARLCAAVLPQYPRPSNSPCVLRKLRSAALAHHNFPRMSTLVFGVEGLTCADCAARLERALQRDAGVRDVAVSLMAGTATVTTKDGGADDSATRALAQRLVAVAAPLGFPITLQTNRDAASLTLDVLTASMGATVAALVALRGVRKVESAGAHGALHTAVVVKYDPAAVGARRLLAACPPAARAAVCTHVADTAELRRHRLRLAAAAFLTVATIVLQYGIPRDVGAYDAAFSGVLTARLLVLWTLATAAGAVFGWPLLRAAAAAAWYSRTMTMDTLVSTSSGVAYVYAVALIVASWTGRAVEGAYALSFTTTAGAQLPSPYNTHHASRCRAGGPAV